MAISIFDQVPLQPYPWGDIFNTVRFYNLHKTENSVYLSFINNDEAIGCIHFSETEKGIFTSPHRGTYGGFDFKEEISLEIIEECVDKALIYVTDKYSAKKITIKTAPAAHNPHRASLIFNTLLNRGFRVSNHEINYTLAVDNIPFIEKMKRNNKKRFNKCGRDGFVFEQENDTNHFEGIYQIIKQNRASKGYEMSMSFDQIMEMYRAFPDSVYFFKTASDAEIIAASICIRVNHNVLYIFYWGGVPGYGAYSPVVFLANGIYEFAREKGYNLIDAGTSSINGAPNYGTAAFKEGLGFEACLKLNYSKTNEQRPETI